MPFLVVYKRLVKQILKMSSAVGIPVIVFLSASFRP